MRKPRIGANVFRSSLVTGLCEASCLCSSRFVRLCGSAIVCLRPHCSIGTEVGRIFARHIQMDNLNKSFRPDGARAESLRSLPVKEVGRRTKRLGGLRGGLSSFELT